MFKKLKAKRAQRRFEKSFAKVFVNECSGLIHVSKTFTGKDPDPITKYYIHCFVANEMLSFLASIYPNHNYEVNVDGAQE